MSKLAPALEKWIEWWHLHRSHIFGPFRMPGLPGVNLAEQGNSSWKPKKPLRLVHAVKNDTATMVLQEEELYEFTRNMPMSTGRGPSDAIHKARWRVEQLYIAKDFVEIFDNIEAVVLEVEEVNEPTSYKPKRWASFKPPKDDESKKNFTTKKVPKSKKKTWSCEKSKRKEFDDGDAREVEERCNTPHVVEEDNMVGGQEVDENGNNEVCKHRMEYNRKRKECCGMCTKEDGKDKSGMKKKQSEDKDGKKNTESIFERAARIMKKNVQQLPPKVERKNPPVVIFTNGLGIKVCKGCPKRITKEQQVYPNNMVFHRWGPGGFINPKTQKHCITECNVHFHLKKTCLRGYDQAVEFKDMTMTKEVFDKLSDE